MVQDLRYAWRILCKSPGFGAIVILTLAFGIGADTAVFSVVRGALLQPLPYRDPSRLVEVFDASLKDADLSHTFETYRDFEEYARHARSFERLAFATWAGAGATWTGRGAARNLLAIPVSEDFFTMLGVAAARGRTFERGDLNGGCSVVLSDRFWRTSLGGDAAIVGQALELNHRACTVLGIMPARFEFYPRPSQLWMLLTPDDPRPRDRFLVLTFGRLKPGVTLQQAQEELAALHRQIDQPEWQRDFTPAVGGLQNEFNFLAARNLRATLGVLMAAVVLVLLIACLNVANLLLARSHTRAHEFAVRAALGSGRARLMRQLLLEGLVLAAMGGAVGVAVAFGLVKYFVHVNPIELPVGSDVAVNLPVLAFTGLLSFATALFFGIAPAWTASRADLNAGLRASGRGVFLAGNRRLTRALIAAEVALSLILLSGAGLLMRSVLKFGAADLGFDPEHVAVMSNRLPPQRYPAGADMLRFYDDLTARLRAIPAVEGATVAVNVPPYGSGSQRVEVAGRGGVGFMDTNAVGEDYFAVLHIGLRRGRLFARDDSASSPPVAIVSQKFADSYLPGVDAIGQRVRSQDEQDAPWLTIVGVVATEKHPELMREMSWHESAELYRPIRQQPASGFAIAVRTHGDQAGTGRAMEQALAAVDPEVAVGEVSMMRETIGLYLKYPRFRAVVLDGFAGLALLLAALGLHGLLAQYVTQRTRELGLRMAIGARRRDIVRLIALQGGIPVLMGMAVGLVATVALTGYLTSLLFEVSPGDPLTMIAAPALLVMAAVAAMVRPVLNAARVDPMVALREE